MFSIPPQNTSVDFRMVFKARVKKYKIIQETFYVTIFFHTASFNVSPKIGV